MASSVVYLISILSLIIIVQESSILLLGEARWIQTTCQRTRLPDLCISILKADPSSQDTGYRGLANIMINAGITSAADTSKYILDKLVKTYTDANAVGVVMGCSTLYDNAKTALEASIRDLNSHDELGDAPDEVDAGAASADTCKNSFSSATPPLAYPDALAQRQKYFQDICGVADDLLEVLMLEI